jgi:hypothetical protein
VTEFLSSAWIADLDAVARASDRLAAIGRESPFVVEQEVSGGPSGNVSYHVVMDSEGGRVTMGPADTADVVLLTDYETALAIHRGETNAQRAIARGRVKLRGDIRQLLRRADALKAIDDVFAAVRADTTASSPGSSGHR